MLRWASLFVCCVVAVRLAAAMGEVTCDTLKSGAPVAIPISNGSLTPKTVLLERCRWANVDVQLLADGPFVVLLRDVQLVGGSLTIVVSGGMNGTTIESVLMLQSSTLINCSKCFCVSSASTPLFYVSLIVAHSIIQATESAATLDAPYVRDCSIRVSDSTVEVLSKASALVASAIAAHADNVRIEAANSHVNATTTSDVACSMGFALRTYGTTTTTANNVTLYATNSSVTATGSYSVASLGFASYSYSGSIITNANNAILFASNSRVTATGGYSAASMGFASYGYSISTITANDAMLYAGNSNVTVTATGGYSVASVGFASYSYSGSTITNANNAILFAANSNVSATVSYYSVASMGFISYCRGSTSTIIANNATLYAANSNVIARGYTAASMGFASYSSSSSTITANNAILYAANSNVTAVGRASVASMGFASYSDSRGNLKIIANSVVLVLCGSRLFGSGGMAVAVVGSDPPPMLPFTARCLLVRSQIVLPGQSCVTLLDGHTEGDLPSLGMDLSFTVLVGWHASRLQPKCGRRLSGPCSIAYEFVPAVQVLPLRRCLPCSCAPVDFLYAASRGKHRPIRFHHESERNSFLESPSDKHCFAKHAFAPATRDHVRDFDEQN